MKLIVLRSVAALPGVVMLVQGIGWLLQPAQQAAALGMPLLDGLGRSTQVGDFFAFFFCTGAFVFFGLIYNSIILPQPVSEPVVRAPGANPAPRTEPQTAPG